MGSTKVGKQKRLSEPSISAQPFKVFRHSERITQHAPACRCWKTDPEFAIGKACWNSDRLSREHAAGGQGESCSHYKDNIVCEDQAHESSRLWEAAKRVNSVASRALATDPPATDPSAVELESIVFLAMLQNFLKAQKPPSAMPLPVFLVDKEVDLFLLCQKVREAKGYQNMSVQEWDRISAILGFATCYGSRLKVIYAKYLKPLESRDALEFHGGKVAVMLVTVVEKLIAKLTSNHINCEDSSTAACIAHPTPSLTPKPSKCEKVQDTQQALCPTEPKCVRNESCELDALAPQLPVSGKLLELGTQAGRQPEEANKYVNNRVRNDGTHDGHLKNAVHWMKSVALNPGGASKGKGPRASWQNKQSVDEYSAITCRLRACLWKRWGAREGNVLTTKAEHINVSNYYDETFYEHCRLLKNRPLSGLHGKIRSSRLSAKALDDIRDHAMPRKRVPIGPDFQADLPPCILHEPYMVSTPSYRYGHEEEVDRWLGTQVWPCPGGKRVVNKERIGRGRPLTCSCAYPKSSACHRLHIRAEKEELMLELGDVFYIWGFDEMGENSLACWTKREQEKFQVIVKTNPASAEKNFWDVLPAVFPARSMNDLVSFYFNVYVLRGREIQNSLHSEVIDSDDDEDEISNYINKTTNYCT